METITMMTTEHPEWETFMERLTGEEACNFTENGWMCFSDHRFSRQILQSMNIEDVEGTIDYFKNRGGYCDCEVCFNVDDE